MINVIEGIKAGGIGKVLLRHLVRVFMSMPAVILLTVLIRFVLDNEILIIWDAAFIGVFSVFLLMQTVDFLAELARNGVRKRNSENTSQT